MTVDFKSTITGEIKSVKIGWSWTLFLFGPIFGAPFFIRKVYRYGISMAVLNILFFLFMTSDGEVMFANITGVALGFYFGLFGNKLTAKYYLENGWEFANEESEEVAVARTTWALV